LHIKKRIDFAEAAKPYISHNIGGHTRETVGHAVLHAQQGYDGVIQLYPLGCMPEIVAQSILVQVSKDYDIPILTLITDEMTGEAGYMTRVEAFVDLLQKRRERKIMQQTSMEVVHG
jgi:predicted nucleotide-binding protein (sugar kinase/HSP70/actin superfamily)